MVGEGDPAPDFELVSDSGEHIELTPIPSGFVGADGERFSTLVDPEAEPPAPRPAASEGGAP